MIPGQLIADDEWFPTVCLRVSKRNTVQQKWMKQIVEPTGEHYVYEEAWRDLPQES
jgi:hypothetical protein